MAAVVESKLVVEEEEVMPQAVAERKSAVVEMPQAVVERKPAVAEIPQAVAERLLVVVETT